MKIVIGCDHAAYETKDKLKDFLIKNGYNVIDEGTNNADSVDYPVYGYAVAKKVVSGIADKGIVICGSGIGISIAANRIKGIRAALCTSELHAKLSRLHNDSNVLALGARLTEYNDILAIVKIWLKTPFEGGRHLNRIEMIDANE